MQCLQSTLNALGYNSGPADGRFGPVTYRAVVRFQQAKRLFVDGIAGRQTGTALGIWGAATAPAVGPRPAEGRPRSGTVDRRGDGRLRDQQRAAAGFVGCSGPLPPIAAHCPRLPGRSARRGVRHDDAQRRRPLPAGEGLARRRRRRPDHRNVTGHLGLGGERRFDGGVGRRPAVHAAGRHTGGGPASRRRQLVGQPRRRRPARAQRRALDAARGWTCPAASAATACAPWPTGDPVTARLRVVSSAWRR